MKTTQEIQTMLDRFDDALRRARRDEDFPDDAEGVRRALEWVLGYHDDAELEDYLPDE